MSDSGKSSLAFDTIAAISENECGSLVNDNKATVQYQIEEYGNVLVAATLKQLNFNVNPRSIILTYFGLHQHMSNVLWQCTHISSDKFLSSGPNRCRKCNGRCTLAQKVNGLNIYEFLNQNIEDIIEKGLFVSGKFEKRLNCYHN